MAVTSISLQAAVTQGALFAVAVAPALSTGFIPGIGSNTPVGSLSLLISAPLLILLALDYKARLRSALDGWAILYALGVSAAAVVGWSATNDSLIAAAVLVATLVVARSWAHAAPEESARRNPFLAITVSAVIVSIASWVFGEFSMSDGRFSVAGSGLSTTVLSRSAGYGIILSVASLLVGNARRRWAVHATLLAGLIMVLTLAGSRAAIAGVLGSVLLMTLLPAQGDRATREVGGRSASRLTRLRIASTRLGLALVIIASIGGNQRVIDGVMRYASNQDVVSTISGRTNLWAAAETSIREEPWFGAGYGQASRAFANLGIWGRDSINQAHNALLESLVTTGLVGTLPLLAIAIWGVWTVSSALAGRWRGVPRLFVPSAGLFTFAMIRSLTEGAFAQAASVDVLVFFVAAFGLQASTDRRSTGSSWVTEPPAATRTWARTGRT